MSTIFLNVGQCGNQVSKSILKTLTSDGEVLQSNTYKCPGGEVRSVHVDSETKVISQMKKSSLNIREKNVICGKKGRGSNWALGYNGFSSGSEDHILTDSEDALRKEIERCDSYYGVILLHSLGGGTGSGLGSRLCELLRDEYPMNYILSCSFAPFSSGDSPLQHYNSLLTLSTLQNYTDGIILTYNDEILYRLHKRMGDKSVSLDQINQYISNHLCGVFLPTDSLRPKKGFNIGSEPWELIRSTCPVPSTKFLHVNHLAKSKLSWEALVGQSLQNLTKYDKQGNAYSCLSSVVIGRGDQTNTFHQSLQKTLNSKIKSAYNCVTWNPFPLDIWSGRSCIVICLSNSSSITIAANYSNINQYLTQLINKAKLMFDNKAYLHWYWRYGATQEMFTESFETVEQIIEDYKSAVK
ncbi:hypothetical protein LOTGIDRAFT_126843 [Lottia gigantea]|uniref:Tubulin delta chain n=1 Tax=Lottia gigantea TaxID=225164 RepID=V4A452_LOTGI|nr:hypothetical protein LOTGIDRAFT_126843 [Lottia gigantea]ESO88026.1 hypothetical protein LOTGIDRAFT_126843 [Lottia gigantea]